MSSFYLSDLISHFWLTSGQVSSSKEKAPPFFPIGILVTTEPVIQSHGVVRLHHSSMPQFKCFLENLDEQSMIKLLKAIYIVK